MADPTPSFDDLYLIGKAEAQATRPALVFAAGDQSTAVVRGGAAMCDYVLGWFAGQIRSMLFNGAVGDELDDIIMDRTHIPRNPAQAAYGTVTFARAGSGDAGIVVEGSEVSTTPDATGLSNSYYTTGDLSYPSGAFSLTIGVSCSLVGTSGNYAPTGGVGTLNIVEALADATITVTTTGFAGGNDVETDTHYLVRAVTHYLTERRATAAALEEGALEVDGVTVARTVEDPDTGITYVRVSDDAGESTLEMEYRVNVAMEAWRAAGVFVSAQGMHASQLVLVISIDDYADGFDVAQAAPTIIDSVTNRLAGGRPGVAVTLDEIRIAAGSPYATQIYKMSFTITLDGTLQSPTSDITPAAGKSIHLQSLSVVDGKA